MMRRDTISQGQINLRQFCHPSAPRALEEPLSLDSPACPGGTTRKPLLRCKARHSICGAIPLRRGSGGSGVPSGRGGQELCSLLGPSPPSRHIGSEQHQTRPSPFSRELRVSGLLCASGLFQYCTVEVCRCPLGGAIPVQGRHQSGVNGELCTVSECQPVSDDFESLPIEHVGLFQIHVADKGAGPRSSSCFSAHLCRGVGGHRHVREVKAGGTLRRRDRSRRKGWSLVPRILLVGTAENVADAEGSHWDRIKLASVCTAVNVVDAKCPHWDRIKLALGWTALANTPRRGTSAGCNAWRRQRGEPVCALSTLSKRGPRTLLLSRMSHTF